MDQDTIPQGLSHAEAARRLRRYGPNTIARKKHVRPLIAFLKKFNSPLLILLILAALISLFIGSYTQGILILAMVFLSAVLDFSNSYKSERVAEALAEKVITYVQALREGALLHVPLVSIVPGDAVFLSAGTVIPADGFLEVNEDMFVNQSALTGECFPVGKRAMEESSAASAVRELLEGATPGDLPPLRPDDTSALFMGSSVVSGSGFMRVVLTGAHTRYGAIAESIISAEPETSFERDLSRFSFFIMRLSFIMVGCVFLAHTILGAQDLLSSFAFALAIAVGLTPELLPVIMSVSLSKGSLVMAKKKVVVRTLSSINNLGAMDVLATDKTGTLTEDKITLVKCVDARGNPSDVVREYAYLSSMFHSRRAGPLDLAIRRAAEMDINAYTKIDEIPFDFERKRDSIVAEKDGARFVITKGAPEEVLGVSVWRSAPDHYGDALLSREDVSAAADTFDRLSSEGYRVLALATRTLEGPLPSHNEYDTTIEKDMVFLGFVAFLDPAKKTAGDAVRTLASLSVETKIITGDSEVLTERVCRDIGLPVKGVLTGTLLHTFSEQELIERVKDTTIFARVTPEEKERIIRALRKGGRTVGYLGDGINDAPALKAADVGISVHNAVDVARETADIILLDKDLGVLGEGIREGRRTFHNTMKYIRMSFSSNFGNMVSMMGASFFLPFLPMLPGQVLLNNMLYDLSQTALPTDNADAEDLKKPLSWDTQGIKRFMLWFGLLSSCFDFLAFFVLYGVLRFSGAPFQTGWFVTSIATQVLVVYIIRTRGSCVRGNAPSRALVLGTAAILLCAWILPYTPLAAPLGFVALPPHVLFVLGAIVGVYLLATEMLKRVFYAMESRRANAS